MFYAGGKCTACHPLRNALSHNVQLEPAEKVAKTVAKKPLEKSLENSLRKSLKKVAKMI